MIIVAGHLRVAPENRDRLLALSREAIERARRTSGCEDYVVAADPLEPDRVNVFERWSDRAALRAFRGEGPRADIGALIASFHVAEYVVDKQTTS